MISIIIPTFNQSNFILYTLYSVKNQTIKDWECLIVDDGSTDNTQKIIEKYILDDKRFVYFKKQNNGSSSARNFGLDHVKGNFILFLDSDDYIKDDKLEKSLHKFEENEECDLVISNFNMFKNTYDEYLPPFCKLENREFSFDSLLLGWDIDFNIPIHCALFKSIIFTNVRFDTTIKSKEDWIMWVSIFKKGVKASFINESLSFYRYNDNGNRYNDDDNFVQAHKIIYNLIDDNNKKKFFERILVDLHNKTLVNKKLKEKYKYLSFKSKLKRFFKKLINI